MRTSFFVLLAAAAAAQARPQPQQSNVPAVAIPPACAPVVPEPDLPAQLQRWFDFQKAYLFDKDVAEAFTFYSADFKSTWRNGAYTRDEFWAQDTTQGWATVASYPTDAYYLNGTGHVSYDLGVNRTGHAGDNFVWEHGCIVSHQQTPA
ncbi:hypothetical protein LY76DRAFT_596634 [Colletotrichum caudatum]|nr:hypothetical protein LY76DRAFT_596634 [Colletotrichum caudatum]